jgi:hypothetical protein
MAELDERDLERTLSELGDRLAYPTADIWPAVRQRISERRARPWVSRLGVSSFGPLVPIFATVVVILVAFFALSPNLIADAERVLGVQGIQIFPTKATPSVAPSAPAQFPGQRAASLADASKQVGFTVRAPTALGEPDAIYVESGAGRVTLVYRTPGAGQRAGIPESPVLPGVSAVVVELKGSFEPSLLGKVVGPGTTMENVVVNGQPGVWLAGQPHLVFYRETSGNIQQETLRLAGNTLVWNESGLAYRVEAPISRDGALAIAATFR